MSQCWPSRVLPHAYYGPGWANYAATTRGNRVQCSDRVGNFTWCLALLHMSKDLLLSSVQRACSAQEMFCNASNSCIGNTTCCTSADCPSGQECPTPGGQCVSSAVGGSVHAMGWDHCYMPTLHIMLGLCKSHRNFLWPRPRWTWYKSRVGVMVACNHS